MSDRTAESLPADRAAFPATWNPPGKTTFSSHAQHVARLAEPQPPVSIHGVELYVPPEVYHPGSGLSSRFFVSALDGRDLAGSVLDLGCGSGFVGLSLYRPGMEIVLADISEVALSSASENLRRLGISARVLRSDLFQALRGQRFDAILFNPPLFDKNIEHQAEVALCDPGGRLLTRFLAAAQDYLNPRGRLYFMASNLMNRRALLDGLRPYRYDIIAATHDAQSAVSRWMICARPA